LEERRAAQVKDNVARSFSPKGEGWDEVIEWEEKRNKLQKYK
jgi:hypothetical protein